MYIILAQVRWGRVKLGNNKSATWKWEEDAEIFVALLLLPQVIFIKFHLKNGWSSSVRESSREKHSFSFLARSRVDVRTDTPIIAIAQFDSQPPISTYIYLLSVYRGVQRSAQRSFTCRAVREGASKSTSYRDASVGLSQGGNTSYLSLKVKSVKVLVPPRHANKFAKVSRSIRK